MSELWDFVAGDQLGVGQYRDVYAFLPDRTKVVKHERDPGGFHNVKEWNVWLELRDCEEAAKWLAPLWAISERGSYLLQTRTSPVLARDMPKRIPAFFTDTKLQNWGRLPNGRVVCHDYGNVLYTFKLRLVKADWWRE